MNIINNMVKELKSLFRLNNNYMVLIIITITAIVLIKFIAHIIVKLYLKKEHRSKQKFKFSQGVNILSNIIIVLSIFIIWESHLSGVITIISFVSAAITVVLKEVILNLFAGFYIRFTRPFVVEDRIEIDGIKGDVVLISLLSFKVLELSGEQSNGIIVSIPTSTIFSYPLKNYTTAFKYIWSEMKLNIAPNAKIDEEKEILYTIVRNNDVIKSIPKKMNKAINDASGTYRIYYNNLDPKIYTEYMDKHIVLTIRFLVHPKKERDVIDNLWQEIIKESQNNNLHLV